MAELQREFGTEFAQIYVTGPGKNGGGGVNYLIQGTFEDVTVPIGPNIRIINHTHPQAFGGELTPLIESPADRNVMRLLEEAGSPQRRSQIVPEIGEPFYFTR
jgi:hypothetical protein